MSPKISSRVRPAMGASSSLSSAPSLLKSCLSVAQRLKRHTAGVEDGRMGGPSSPLPGYCAFPDTPGDSTQKEADGRIIERGMCCRTAGKSFHAMVSQRPSSKQGCSFDAFGFPSDAG